ncbi:MAG: ribonuclease III [Methylophilaceae bacterium]
MSQAALLVSLGHEFRQPALLTQALTHRSHSSANNERLEFLGDSVLNCVIAAQLYQRFPQLAEGDLSRLRAHLVKEPSLAEIATRLDIGAQLKLGDGEIKSGGSKRPSVLADAIEALIGAVYLDAGFAAAETLVIRLYADLLQHLDPVHLGKDAKTMLQEHLQGCKIDLPKYTVVETQGEAHCQTFIVECSIPALKINTKAQAGSRRAAEQLAAQLAYEEISHER